MTAPSSPELGSGHEEGQENCTMCLNLDGRTLLKEDVVGHGKECADLLFHIMKPIFLLCVTYGTI